MKKLLNFKYSWAIMVAVFVALIYASSIFFYRLDLTAEKRFSLNATTKKLFNQVDDVIRVQVFLSGDLPTDYKKLSLATKDFLEELKQVSNNKIVVSFEKPGDDLTNDTAKAILYDSLSRLGIVFERSEVTEKKDEKETNRLIIPSALVSYKDHRPIAVDLRSSKKIYKQFNVINDIPQEDVEATRNAAEALLEFKFASAIDKLTRSSIPTIAYTVGNGEPIDKTVNDLGESLRTEYHLGIFDLKSAYPDATKIDALLIVKPTREFTDEDKLKLDQYVMNGGKIIWCIDKLHAELDSLMRSKSEYTAYDRGLNVDDILFKYGVRINDDLLQDLNCSKLPIVIGYNPDKSPRMQRVPWPYYPLLATTTDNPISKNLDKVLPIFPSSIDTVKTEGIKKTVLLASDSNSRVLGSPALVSVNSVKTEEDLRSFTRGYVPVVVLLEGKFKSLFANRLTAHVTDSIQKATNKPYQSIGSRDSKQIVMSDADIVTNAVSSTNGSLSMGELPFDNYRFANREFLLNCVDYLISNSGIFATRNKEFTLRLLDKKKVADERSKWQFINIVAPIALVILIGLLLQWKRKRKYTL